MTERACVTCGQPRKPWGQLYCKPCTPYRPHPSKALKKTCQRCKESPRAVGASRYCAPCGPLAKEENLAARVRTPEQQEAARQRANAHYRANREKVLARMSTPEGREYSRNRMREKMKDPGFRLHSNMSRAIREALNGHKAGRRWEALVGYTCAELVAHLERQFAKGMNWENMGKWEIDHILPRCGFHLSNPDEFRQCWSLTNLRPLWAKANRAKSGNRLHLL